MVSGPLDGSAEMTLLTHIGGVYAFWVAAVSYIIAAAEAFLTRATQGSTKAKLTCEGGHRPYPDFSTRHHRRVQRKTVA